MHVSVRVSEASLHLLYSLSYIITLFILGKNNKCGDILLVLYK